jgi:hypothetical protein
MSIRISFRTATLLGLAGWILFAYPVSILAFDLIRSGQTLRVCFEFLYNGKVDSGTVMVGQSLLPVPPLILLAMVYLESLGRLPVNVRRIVSGLAAVLMLLATGWTAPIMVPRLFPWVGPAPAGWSTASATAASGLAVAFSLTWALLMVIFAVRRAPLRDRITGITTSLIAVLSAAEMFAAVSSLALQSGFRLKYPLGHAIEITALVSILLFAIYTTKAASLARRTVR